MNNCCRNTNPCCPEPNPCCCKNNSYGNSFFVILILFILLAIIFGACIGW
ncbi:MAG: hypothetical protein HFE04_01860 [Bacilli bacterium]|nr:hypothetical protein [Bacilli bacterium]